MKNIYLICCLMAMAPLAKAQDTLKIKKTPKNMAPAMFVKSGSTYHLIADTSSMRMPTESAYFKIGDQIKSFSGHDLEGNKLSLKSLRGKVVVLSFLFLESKTCRMQIPDMNKVAALYKDNPDVVFIALTLDRDDAIKDFLHQLAFYDVTLNYHFIADARDIAKRYGVLLYPTNVILDKEGKVTWHWVGHTPSVPYWMKKRINASLQ